LVIKAKVPVGVTAEAMIGQDFNFFDPGMFYTKLNGFLQVLIAIVKAGN
jgi:hypothetical protein